MNVEVISIGTKLLMSDIIDINTPYISRILRELNIPLTCKVTVGEDPEMIAKVLRVAWQRATVVVAIGASDDDVGDVTREALAQVTGRTLLQDPPGISDARLLGNGTSDRFGLLLEEQGKAIFLLPGNRRLMAHLLDTEVLPYLQQKLPEDQRPGRALLRTADIMESSLEQQLADLALGPQHRITYDSFAGQTNIHLWVEGGSPLEISNTLEKLKEDVISRLGDHVFGEEEDRLEEVVLTALRKSGQSLTIAENNTHKTLSQLLEKHGGFSDLVTIAPAETPQELAEHLGMEASDPAGDPARWSRLAAEHLQAKTGSGLGLVILNHGTPGGVQIFIVLASSYGTSVTHRSFGGYPDNIDQWAQTLGLAHLRRWLLAHG